MRNLLTNAFRYGGDAIRVSLATLGDTVSVVVADNGEGVDPSDETAIFQPYRGGKAIEQVPGSTGLGLWIARSLAHKMGGNVSYRRQSGQTVFELTLPAGPVPDVVDDPAWLSTSSAH
jgi:signal transduction histidine kinase